MGSPASPSDLSDVRALLEAYAALRPRERRALLELAQAMAPPRPWTAADLEWLSGQGPPIRKA